MSKEKQIEEMWNIITTDCDGECVGCEYENEDWCFTHHVINNLYNAGYRKQSEGEWKKVYQNDKAAVYECSRCGHLTLGTSDYCICGAKMKGGE